MIHVISAKTCTEAWLSAAELLFEQEGHETHSMVLDIERPLEMTASDRRVYEELDLFLREHDQLPVVTVAGTIFPGGIYLRHGARGVLEMYPQKIYPKIREQWGNYASRMLSRRKEDGTVMNPLEVLVGKLRKQIKSGHPLKGAYELNTVDLFTDLNIYDSTADATRTLSQPCLSHLSFRIRNDNSLMLTVLYRSHYYVQKTLGNLIGLAQLQYFVAAEAELAVGPLICHSSYATLKSLRSEWSKTELATLLKKCRKAAHAVAA